MEYVGSRAYEWLKARGLYPVTVYERSVLVNTAPAEVVQQNPRRLVLVLANHGGVPIRIGFSSAGLSAGGVIVAANGGIVILSVDEDYEAVTYSIYGQGIGGSANVYVSEVVAL